MAGKHISAAVLAISCLALLASALPPTDDTCDVVDQDCPWPTFDLTSTDVLCPTPGSEYSESEGTCFTPCPQGWEPNYDVDDLTTCVVACPAGYVGQGTLSGGAHVCAKCPSRSSARLQKVHGKWVWNCVVGRAVVARARITTSKPVQRATEEPTCPEGSVNDGTMCISCDPGPEYGYVGPFAVQPADGMAECAPVQCCSAAPPLPPADYETGDYDANDDEDESMDP